MTKKTNFKKHLLASASVLAIGAFATQGAFAADVNRATGGTSAATAGQTVEFTSTVADDLTGIVTVADGITIGAVTVADAAATATDGIGTLTFQGSGGTTTIGLTAKRLGLLNAGVAGSSVTISGASFVDATSITGTGTLNLGGLLTGATLNYAADGTVNLASGVGLTLSTGVTATGGDAVTGRGTLTLAGGTQTVAGAVGVTGARLKVVNAGATGATSTFSNNVFAVTTNVTGTGAVNFAGDVTGTTLAFAADGTVTAADDGDIVMTSITSTGAGTAGRGTINLAGTAARLLSGNVGTTTDYVKKIAFTGANAATTNGDLYATTIDFTNNAATLNVVNGKNIGGTVISTGGANGTLTFSGATTADSTVTGALGGSAGTAVATVNHIAGLDGSVLTLNGASNFVTTLNIGAGQVALNGDWTGTAINMAAAADLTGKLTVAAGKTLTGAVTVATGGEGNVEFAGAGTITGNLGTAGNGLNLLTINSGLLTTGGNVAAATVNFAADGSLSIASTKVLTGAVTNTTNGQGTVTFAGSATVTGSLGATSHLLKLVTVGNGAVVQSTGSNLYATTLNFAGDNTYTFTAAAGNVLNAAVTTSTNNTGTLTIVGAGGSTNTLTGNVGTSTAALKKVNVGNTGTTTTTLTGDVYATTVDFNTDSTISFVSGSDIFGAVTSTADNEGNITTAGSSAFSGKIGTSQAASLNTLTVNSTTGSTVSFADDAYFNVVTAAGAASGSKIAIAAGKTLSTGSQMTLARTGAATYSFGIKRVVGGTDLVGNISTLAGGAAIFTNAVFNAEVDGTSNYIAAGDTFTVVNGNTGAATIPVAAVTDNSYAVNFTASAVGNNIVLTAAQANALSNSSSLGNVKSIGAAVDAVKNGGDASLDATFAGVQALGSAGAVESALKTLDATNTTSGQTTQALIAVSDASLGTVESRLEVARNESAGVATGSRSANNGAWGQVFGSSVDQGQREGVDGYQANIAGGAIGADAAINNQTRLGAAFAYGRTDAEGTRNEAEIDSYQGSIYGSYDMGKVYYEGIGTFGWNKFDTSRTLFNGSVASGDFEGQQYSAKATAGYKVDVQGGLKVTPFVSAQYVYLTQDDYTETGSTANLHVNADDINIFKTGIGAKLAYPILDAGITYTPRLSAAWYYDWVGDESSATSNFSSAAATTFNSKGADVAQSEFKLGAGLDVLAQDNVTVSLDYSWNSKEDYDAHTGELKARFEF